MSADAPRRGPLRWLTDDLGNKLLAVVLAAVVFVVTRDEVVRTYPVPLRVIEDPARVLLTPLPDTVELELRGPWTRLSRLGGGMLGSAELDLSSAAPGPLHLDPATIVMPEGVLLSRLVYEPVDLRFDDFVERELPVVLRVFGQPHVDYELESASLDTHEWGLRGAATVIDQIAEIETESVSITGVTDSFERKVALVRPRDDVSFLEVGDALPRVTVSVSVRARAGEMTHRVDLAAAFSSIAEGDTQIVKSVQVITVKGPRPLLRRLQSRTDPIEVEMRPIRRRGAVEAVEVSFGAPPDLDADARASLNFDPEHIQVAVERRR